MALADPCRASFGRAYGLARRVAATLSGAAGNAGLGVDSRLHPRHRQGAAHGLHRLCRVPGRADPRQYPLGPRAPEIRADLAALPPLASFERRRGDRQELRRSPAGHRLALRDVLYAEGRADMAASLWHDRNAAAEGDCAAVLLPFPTASRSRPDWPARRRVAPHA